MRTAVCLLAAISLRTPSMITRIRHTGALWLCTLVLVLTACGSESPTGGEEADTPLPPNTIGPSGGTLDFAGGNVTLVFPAGAVSQNLTVTVQATGTFPSAPTVVSGTAYDFGPTGTVFAQPVQLTVKYDSPSLPSGVQESELSLHKVLGSAWQKVAGSRVNVTDNTVSGAINSFSVFGILGVAVASVTVMPDNVSIVLGEMVQLTATVVGAEGNALTERAVSWSSSEPEIATVDGNGQVAGMAQGLAIITATSEGQSGMAAVRVIPDVSGAWSGQYMVTSCMRSGATVAVFCVDVFAVDQSLIIDLDLVQSSAELAGDIAQGQLLGAVEGRVDENGVVVLSGTIGGAAEFATTTILSWQTGLVGDSLIGSWRFQTVDNTGAGVGTATVDALLRLFGPSVPKFFGCPAEGTLTFGGTISGELTGTDCELADRSFFDVYALSVSAGDSVSIALRSTSFDAFLLIADADGQLVDGDDDSGGGPNGTDAQVIRRFTIGGTFFVIANSFAGGETGPYTLSADRLAPSGSVANLAPPELTAGSRFRVVKGGTLKQKRSLNLYRAPVVRKLTTPPGWSGKG